MIKSSLTRPAATGSAKRQARQRRLARACVLLLLMLRLFDPAALSKPALLLVQTSNIVEGLKRLQEGQRLAALRTRTSTVKAIEEFKAAYEFFKKDNLREGMGTALYAAGASYSSLGQKRRALEAFLGALTHMKEAGDPSLRGLLLAGIGLAYSDLSEWKPAIEYLEQALTLLQAEVNPEAVSSVLCGLGGTYIKLGQKQKGLSYLDRALRLAQELPDRRPEVSTRLLIGATLSSLGQKRKAIEFAERALQIAREQKNRSQEVSALLSLGAIHSSLGDQRRALNEYNEALRITTEFNDGMRRVSVLGRMASVYLDLGEIEKALAIYEESIRVSEAEGDPEGASTSFNGLGMIYALRAEPLKAIAYHQRSLELARADKHQSREAAALINIARVYHSFGEHEQALKANQDALATFRAVEDPAGEASALANIGAIYTGLGRRSEALEYLNLALERHRAIENRSGQAYTLLAIGDIHREAGDLAEALGTYAESLALMAAVEDRVGEAKACNSLGFAYYHQRDNQKASEYYLRALRLTRQTGDRIGEATLLGNLGLLRERMGELREGEELYSQAIEVRERVRTAARLEEFKTVAADQSAELYSRAILLKLKLGKAADAFELSERARARTLLDQINGVRINMRKSADRELIEREQSLRLELASLEKNLQEEMASGGSPEASALIGERLKQGQQAYADLIVRLKASNPEYAELQGHSPISRVEIQRLLGSGTTLLSYYVTASKTLVFVLTRDSLNVVEVPAGEKELRNAIDWFRSFTSLRSRGSASLRQLYGWLITPIRQYIKTKMVCVIPHGILHQLPFAALNAGRSYFGEQHTIYHLPAASLMPSIEERGRRSGSRMLAVAEAKAAGLPFLRYVDQEAEAMARLYRGKALLSGRASKPEVLKLIADYDILHIASHAELNTRSPLFSRILLSPDQNGSQALEVREIYDLNLNHMSLITLSACQTQLGAQSRGDDIVGLNRAFIYAGASTVIASLWAVDDLATSLLMRSFYTHLKRGMGKAEALRLAQSETRRRYADPYYWAGFILTGDAGPVKRPRSNGRRPPGPRH